MLHGREGLVTDLRRRMEEDLADGVRLRLTNVLASRDLFVIEGAFENPPDDPFHCPPAMVEVHLLRGGLTDRHVIVVGARVAGASTAMLLARRGLKVLVVDRTTFPSDTLSTHQVQLPGVARLKRWGLLDRVIASGAPAARHVRFDPGLVVLECRFPAYQGVDALYSPRRTVLDGILVDAAREAGA
nr:FAD-dependent oxidoreductase [Rubrobacter calidifluminis]